ncbi:MAG TPA: Holliday junction branch migration protein RuvA [Acidimicrobiales bacterium]|jgi:holliday junction DNA helicase RuvA|nr:Holliday junction branch migration protein RuvA [Acidimicrobiales bacterium]
MIGSLRGILLDRSAKGEVLVEVAGVGYRVQVTPSAMASLGDLGGPVFLHVHTHVREDALVLYGFPTADERGCFEALLGTHGVGPALALAVLSVHSPVALRRIVATDDTDGLTLVPGIGKKGAARLLLELKSRLELPEADLDDIPSSVAAGSARVEVKAALAQLGYGPEEVRLAVGHLPEEGTVEDLLRAALRTLSAAARS